MRLSNLLRPSRLARRAGFALALGLAASAAATQAPPAAPTPNGRRLAPGIDSLAIYLVRAGDTTRTGVVYDELVQLEERGRPLLLRVYRSADRLLGNRLDTLVDDRATLAPVRHRSRSSNSQEFLDFRSGRVTGWMRLVNGDSVSVDVPLAGLAFNGSTVDLVLRASDLRAGWEAIVPAFLAPTRTVVPIRARVAGAETVRGERCWRVQAEFAGMPVTMWVGQTSRRLLQQSMQLRPDMQILFGAFPRPAAGRAT
jgi:hypothetical protein